jgi:heptosyltransferase-3
VHPHRGTLAEALALIADARTSIVPDSGLMHFAAASLGGVLGLCADPHSPGAADRWGPVGPRAHFLQARNAVAEIPDDAVLAAIESLVAASPAFV